jgi:hypothetical protein
MTDNKGSMNAAIFQEKLLETLYSDSRWMDNVYRYGGSGRFFAIWKKFPTISKYIDDVDLNLQKIYEGEKPNVISVNANEEGIQSVELIYDEIFVEVKANKDYEENVKISYNARFSDRPLEEVDTFTKDFVRKYSNAQVDESSKITMHMIIHKGGYQWKLEKFLINKPDVDINLNYGKNFPETHEKIKKVLNEDRPGLLLFHSLPGTGKSKYLQYLSHSMPGKKFVFMSPNLLASLNKEELTKFVTKFLKNTVLIVEDCEIVLQDRDAGDNPYISVLLNLTSGILGDLIGCKVICTFNTDTKNIDSALLRKGRLLLQHKFEPLTMDEANTLYKKLYNSEDNYFTKEATLAEVYNLDENHAEIAKKQKRTIGFQTGN